MRIVIIGAGVSGLTAARLLKDKYDVKVFEKNSRPGGLIKCRRVNGSLFHTCGGHVFNSKRQDVLDWFWKQFSQTEDFTKTDRNSVVFMGDGRQIPYPIENHMYLFDRNTQKDFIDNLVQMAKRGEVKSDNFEDFLRNRFGETLYKIYFKPYNEKVWRRSLRHVPLTWLAGKLPMPTIEEMIYNNFNHVEERSFVHARFWYEKLGGSQFIADTLSKGLDITYNADIENIKLTTDGWNVNGEVFDKVIFCGNIKQMPSLIHGVDINKYVNEIDALEYHGTTSVFCEIDANPYSWIYQPSTTHESHRIICTGNFSKNNNSADIAQGRITGTVEFTDAISKEDIVDNLSRMPLHPVYLDHQYNKYTYPIQDECTREMTKALKNDLSAKSFYFTGRFADWEYYNMDIAMGAAMDLCKTL